MKSRLILLALLSAAQLFGQSNPISNLKFTTDVNGNGQNISDVFINGLRLEGTDGPFTFSGTGAVLLTTGSGSLLTLNSSGFDGNLTVGDDTLQEIAQKLDDLVAGDGGITDIQEDATPQLGGDLDLNGHVITGMVIGQNIEGHTIALSQWGATNSSTATRGFISNPTSANFAAMLSDKNGTGKVLFAQGTLNISTGQVLTVTSSGTLNTMAYQSATSGTEIQKANGFGGLMPVDPNEVYTFTEPGYNFLPYHITGSTWSEAKFDTDITLAANTDIAIASQRATKMYVDNKIATGAYNAATWDGDLTHTASLDALRDKIESIGGGSGSGTVTTFSSGSLAPIFATNVTNPSTTPALTFTLSALAANTLLGNSSSAVGVTTAIPALTVRTMLGLQFTDRVQFSNVQLGSSTLVWTPITVVDFNATDRFKTIALTGNTEFQASNLAAGRVKEIKIICDSTTRSLVFPAGWTWVGGVAPLSIPASQSAVLTLTSYGTTDSGVVATFRLRDFSATGISNVVEDTTPELGGNLNLNGHVITGVPNLDTDNTFTLENTFTGGIVSSGSALTLVGPISAPQWLNNGVRIKQGDTIVTDTTSSGTVAQSVTNVFGGSTIAATSPTTFTTYLETYFKNPAQGTNVTIGNPYALGADSLLVTGKSSFGTVNLNGNMAFAGSITPPVLTGNVNDYSPGFIGTANAIRQDGGTVDRLITGIAGGSMGRIMVFVNIGTTNNITLKNSDSGSATTNRFLASGDILLTPNQSITLRYDGITLRWRPLNLSAAGTESSNSVPNGKLGVSSLTPYGIIFGGTTTTGPVQVGALGTAGQGLTSNGPGSLPTFQDRPAVSLASSPIDLTTAANTPIYTIPAGKTFLLMSARAITTAITGTATTHAVVYLQSGTGNAVSMQGTFAAASEVVGKGKDMNAGPTVIHTIVAGDVLNATVSVASNATVHDAIFVIQGVLY